MKILVVDDNSTNLKVTQLYLSEFDYTVKTVTNGKAAIAILSKEIFDVILMDIEMPVMNGVEASKNIREGNVLEENISIPIIAITAHHRQETDDFKKHGITDLLTKPLNYPLLQRKIEEIQNTNK